MILWSCIFWSRGIYKKKKRGLSNMISYVSYLLLQNICIEGPKSFPLWISYHTQTENQRRSWGVNLSISLSPSKRVRHSQAERLRKVIGETQQKNPSKLRLFWDEGPTTQARKSWKWLCLKLNINLKRGLTTSGVLIFKTRSIAPGINKGGWV